MCPTGKICYKTKIDAQFALYECTRNKMHSNNRNEKRVYFCPLCKQFHLTSHAATKIETWRDLNNARHK